MWIRKVLRVELDDQRNAGQLRLGSGGVHDASPTALEHDRAMWPNGSIEVERPVPELTTDPVDCTPGYYLGGREASAPVIERVDPGSPPA